MGKRRSAAARMARLASTHKWYLGGGRRVLWAPEFPVFLQRPGFWDAGTWLDVKIGSLFTFALLEDGRPLIWKQESRVWRPDEMTCVYDCGRNLRIRETKSVRPDDSFQSVLELRNLSARPRRLELVMWGRVDATDIGSTRFGQVQADRGGVTGVYERFNAAGVCEHAILMRWTLARGRSRCTSAAVAVSEPGDERPNWEATPFFEMFDGTLPAICEFRGGMEDRGVGRPVNKAVFVGLHRRISLQARSSTRVIGACRLSEQGRGEQAPAAIAAGTRACLRDWSSFYDATPRFECSDPFLEKYFDYRWYGLRLNTIEHGEPPLRHPCVFEGVNPGWFRHAISYSAQVLPRDLRWLRDPTLARGCILNFLENQRNDGFIPGGILTGRVERRRHSEHMYHANWGDAVCAVHEIHPDAAFVEACYGPLSRYAEWLKRERDREDSGLYDVCSQAESGQEYMSRYLFVDERADEWGSFRLKGVDATVYAHQLQESLAWMAGLLNADDDAERWRRRAEKTARAVREKMWNAKLNKFCDVDPRTGGRSPVKACTDFYPFMTNIVDAEHLPAIREHLLNPNEFWTEWPAPSTSLDDRTADPCGRWLDKRHNCPWNGRTWLMTNSHVAEALARSALQLDAALEPYAATFITRFIHMLFADGDIRRPTSFEYYNPRTGDAPFFRGVDDYMHSWIIDLIVKYVVGLRPAVDGRIEIRPLQFGLKRFALDHCYVAGRPVRVTWNGRELSASVGRARRTVRGLGRIAFSAM